MEPKPKTRYNTCILINGNFHEHRILVNLDDEEFTKLENFVKDPHSKIIQIKDKLSFTKESFVYFRRGNFS